MKTPILDHLFDYFNQPENFNRKLYLYAKTYIFSEELGKQTFSKGREFMIKRSKHNNVLRLFDQEDFMHVEIPLFTRSSETEAMLNQFILNSQDAIYCQATLPTAYVENELAEIMSKTAGLDFLLKNTKGNGETTGIIVVRYYFLLKQLVETLEKHLENVAHNEMMKLQIKDVIDASFIIDIDIAETELILCNNDI